MADWHYIGHYGQLGPLTDEQMRDLIQSGVIERDTYVWMAGMSDWNLASRVAELSGLFAAIPPSPPPTPGSASIPPVRNDQPPIGAYATTTMSMQSFDSLGYRARLESDKSRVTAGILNIVLPGVGRLYLGFTIVGVMQLLFMFCGVGWVWGVIDGILILIGSVETDGYGRQLVR